MDLLTIFAASFAALITIGVCMFYWKVRRLPRGPIPLPLLGNFLQIDFESPHRSFVAWRQKYGPIFTIWLPKPIIVFAGFEEMEKYFVKDRDGTYDDRPMSFLYTMFVKNKKDGDGIILARGDRSKRERAMALNFFGQIGRRMDGIIDVHTAELVARLRNKVEIVDDIQHQFACCFGNVINDIVMGRHYGYDDPEFNQIIVMIDRLVKSVSGVQMLLVDNVPILRFFFPTYWQYLKDGYDLQQFFLDEIDRHIAHLDLHCEPDNFIDAYLINALKNDPNVVFTDEFRLTLALDSGDLWAGGLETVVITLTWAIVFMIHHPEIQQKLWNELTKGLGGAPYTTGSRIPYLQAFIDELQRIVNVLPWGLPHSSKNEMTLMGKKVPAGTGAMPEVGAVHFDENNFEEPYKFNPERFLNDEGNYQKSAMLRPFGVGKRQCLGQILAKKEIQIVLAALVLNFEFEAVDPANPPSLKRRTGMTAPPHQFSCRIKLRAN